MSEELMAELKAIESEVDSMVGRYLAKSKAAESVWEASKWKEWTASLGDVLLSIRAEIAARSEDSERT